MKIGIFGDSYGDENLTQAKCIGWPTILSNRGYTIANFSKSGSSFYYSYKLYERHHKEFDKNIFLVTHPSRIHVNSFNVEQFKHVNPATLTEFISIASKNKDKYNLKILQAVISYYQLIHNYEYAVDAQNALLSQILNHNTIVIPCFSDSIKMTETSLFDWFEKENRFLKYNKLIEVTTKQGLKIEDSRVCHLTEENNVVLANLIEDAIKTDKVKLDLSIDQVVKPIKGINYYFTQVSV
jgi:hypothetical protein